MNDFRYCDMFYFLLSVIVMMHLYVYLFQLPQWKNYTFGLHTVMSVLRLAAGKLHDAVRSANREQACRTRSTHLHSEGGESNKDVAQSVSSAASHATSSSRCHYLSS